MVLSAIGDVELSHPDLERRDAEAEGERGCGVGGPFQIDRFIADYAYAFSGASHLSGMCLIMCGFHFYQGIDEGSTYNFSSRWH